MSAYDRSVAIKNQSGDYKTDYVKVKDEIIAAGGLAEDFPPGHSLHDMVTRQDGYQVHHIVPLSAVNPLFDNTTPEQGKQLQEIIHSGNHPKNLYVTPSKSHYGNRDTGFEGVHKRLQNEGLQVSYPKGQGPIDISGANELIKQIYLARNAPFEVKVALAQQFKEQLVPEYHNHLNDALTENVEYSQVPGNRRAAREVAQVRLNSAKRHLL